MTSFFFWLYQLRWSAIIGNYYLLVKIRAIPPSITSFLTWTKWLLAALPSESTSSSSNTMGVACFSVGSSLGIDPTYILLIHKAKGFLFNLEGLIRKLTASGSRPYKSIKSNQYQSIINALLLARQWVPCLCSEMGYVFLDFLIIQR